MIMRATAKISYYVHVEVEADNFEDCIKKLSQEKFQIPKYAFDSNMTYELDSIETEVENQLVEPRTKAGSLD